MKDSLWSVDLFRCESILLKTHWVMVVMDQFTRGIIGFGVHVGDVDGPALCRMFNAAIVGKSCPKHLRNEQRTHSDIEGSTSAIKSGASRVHFANLDRYQWQKHCGKLFQLPIAA